MRSKPAGPIVDFRPPKGASIAQAAQKADAATQDTAQKPEKSISDDRNEKTDPAISVPETPEPGHLSEHIDSAAQNSAIVSPEGALSFLFSIFALLMGFMAILENINQATLLSVGVTWLILSLGALIASLINMIRGSDKGNTNLLATVLLGIFPGINTLITLDALANGISYKPIIVGLMYIVGAVLCFGATCTRRNEPLYIFIRTFAVACGLLFVGFGDMISSQMFLAAGGVFLFLYSLLSIYYGLSILYPSYGYWLPQGRSLQMLLDKRKNQKQNYSSTHPDHSSIQKPDADSGRIQGNSEEKRIPQSEGQLKPEWKGGVDHENR